MLQYATIGLLYTRTCPLSCGHCIIESSPKAQGKMEPDEAREYIRTIAHHSDQVCFSGGEPLLYYNEVVELVRFAVDLGLVVTLVTGAGWVRTDKAHIARERVAGLKAAGIQKIAISWDSYHEEFSPRENAALLASLVNEYGIELIIRGVAPATQPRPFPTEALGGLPAEFRSLVQLGSAKSLPENHFFKMAEPLFGTCGVVLSPAIEPDGQVYACCGPSRFSQAGSPLILGNTNEESLDAILYRGARDPLLRALLLVGPRGLYDLLKATPEYRAVFKHRAAYNSICDVCLDMTDVPEIVAALRARLTETDGRALLIAAEMKHRLRQSQSTLPSASLSSPEVHHVG